MRSAKLKRGKQLMGDHAAVIQSVEAATPVQLDRLLDDIGAAPEMSFAEALAATSRGERLPRHILEKYRISPIPVFNSDDDGELGERFISDFD